MRKKKAWLTAVLASLVVVLALEPAQHNPIDLEGTYRLVSRDLPDGSTITPPDIEGMITFANGYRNFNVYWHDETGKATSISIIAEYELTEDTYTETNIYAMTNDEIAGTGVTYDLESTSGSAPVTREDGSLSMKLPLRDEPAVVIDEDGFTATREGEFVDHWERIE